MKVTFDESLNIVHYMIAWRYAYRSHRQKYWENLAVDRWRFQNRIFKFQNIINPVLAIEHRHKIYCDRFISDCEKSKRNKTSNIH